MIYTNFEILIAIYAFLTMTALFSPVEHFFRQNLTNMLFMTIIIFIVVNTPFDVSYVYSLDSLLLMKDKMIIIGSTIIIIALFLRFKDSSLYDTLFLGFGVYTVIFIGIMSLDLLSPFIDTFLFYVFFYVGLIGFIWNKLLISMIFSIKRIADSY